MSELVQLYSEDAQPIAGKGGTKDKIYSGALHGASHVWIWRRIPAGIEVLVQKRAANKKTWSNFLDISAAGHIDLGETPLEAAVRETNEELGLEINPSDLKLLKIHRAKTVAPSGQVENEFKWIYVYELAADTDFKLQTEEVGSVTWKPLQQLKSEISGPAEDNRYVPQGDGYFEVLLNYLEQL